MRSLTAMSAPRWRPRHLGGDFFEHLRRSCALPAMAPTGAAPRRHAGLARSMQQVFAWRPLMLRYAVLVVFVLPWILTALIAIAAAIDGSLPARRRHHATA